MIEILLFIGSIGCAPRFEVQDDPTLDRPGRQQGGIVRVRTADPGVLVHELWHVCQEAARGVATSTDESARREDEARTVELMWRQRDR